MQVAGAWRHAGHLEKPGCPPFLITSK